MRIDFSRWTQITSSDLAPQPISFQYFSFVIIRIFVFGGWIPLISSDRNAQYTNKKE